MIDFLKGTLGVLAQIALTILGLMFMIGGLIACASSSTSGMGGLLVIIGIVCFCAIAGIRYWLGNIVRIR